MSDNKLGKRSVVSILEITCFFVYKQLGVYNLGSVANILSNKLINKDLYLIIKSLNAALILTKLKNIISILLKITKNFCYSTTNIAATPLNNAQPWRLSFSEGW